MNNEIDKALLDKQIEPDTPFVIEEPSSADF